MPDPKSLKVGDRVRFVAIPTEWSQPDFTVQPCDRSFMKKMICRTWPSRIDKIDEYGQPWISARIREKDGKFHFHSWAIFESTGWRLVNRRVVNRKKRRR
jgi:hypothetical protein